MCRKTDGWCVEHDKTKANTLAEVSNNRWYRYGHFTRINANQLVLTVQFPSLKTVVPEIEEVKLSDEGIATWKAVANAGKYEVLFYKNGTAAVTPVVSDANSFNCRPRMGKGTGSYHIKVRAVSGHDENSKGKWTESNSIHVDKEKSENFRMYPDGQHVGSDGAKTEKSAVTGAKEEDPDEAMCKEWAQLQGDDTEDEDE